MALPLSRASRWGWRSRPAAPSRIEVCPPSLLRLPGSAWQRLLAWMVAPAPLDGAPPPNRLVQVRADFIAALADIEGDPAHALCQRVQQALTLRELWHLRSDVFRAVGLAHGEGVATLRVKRLNRHFPTRAPRTRRSAP